MWAPKTQITHVVVWKPASMREPSECVPPTQRTMGQENQMEGSFLRGVTMNQNKITFEL